MASAPPSPSPLQQAEAKQAAATAAVDKDALKRALDVQTAVLKHPSKRTHADSNKIAAFLTTVPGPNTLNSIALNHLAHCVVGIRFMLNEEIYVVGEFADSYYMVMLGQVTLFDTREKDDVEATSDPIVKCLGINDGFGEEELICGGRRAYSARATMRDTLLLRIRADDYKRGLEVLHDSLFDDKVGFLATLSPFRALTPLAVRSIAPAFHEVLFKKGEFLVKQGDRADCMYAINAGSVVVYVDPHYKEGNGMVAELDPKKIMQVCQLGVGNIIGDMTVLADAKTRTATVVAASDVMAYRVRKALFLRRVPLDVLAIMHRVAADKLRLTTKQVQRQPVVQSLKDKILHGHNLRELLSQSEARQVTPSPKSEEYDKLISLLRQQKRAGRNTVGGGKHLRPHSTPSAQPVATASRARPITSAGTEPSSESLDGQSAGARLAATLDQGAARMARHASGMGQAASAPVVPSPSWQQSESDKLASTSEAWPQQPSNQQQQQQQQQPPHPLSVHHDINSIPGRIAAVYSHNTVEYWTQERAGHPHATIEANAQRAQQQGQPHWAPPPIPRTGNHYLASPHSPTPLSPSGAPRSSPLPDLLQAPPWSPGTTGGGASSALLMVARSVSPLSKPSSPTAATQRDAAAAAAAATAGGGSGSASPHRLKGSFALPSIVIDSAAGDVAPGPSTAPAMSATQRRSGVSYQSPAGAGGFSSGGRGSPIPEERFGARFGVASTRSDAATLAAAHEFAEGWKASSSPQRADSRVPGMPGVLVSASTWSTTQLSSVMAKNSPKQTPARRKSGMEKGGGSDAPCEVDVRVMIIPPRAQQEIDDLLDSIAQPLMANKFGHVHKSSTHFRPNIPKTFL